MTQLTRKKFRRVVGLDSKVRSFAIGAIFFLLSASLIAMSFGFTNYGTNSSADGILVKPSSIYVIKSSTNSPVKCSTAALCPNSLTQAYGFQTLFKHDINGRGQTIDIVDACGDPTISTDLTAFDSQFRLSNPAFKVIDVQGTPKTCDPNWGGETALDVEWAHAVAPSASIDLLVTTNPSAKAMYGAWTFALNNHLGNQISNSWGGAGCSVAPCNNTIGQGIGPCTMINGTQGVSVTNVLDRAEKENVTVLAAAGDSASWGLGAANEEPVPGDCQGVLTVGGTALSVSSSGTYIGETAWGSSGGGYATAPKEPQFQLNAGIKDPFGTLAKPDVAADASCSSQVWVIEQGVWDKICGTSLATPLWAGFMADVNQARANNHLFPAGYINSYLYSTILRNSKLYSSDFHDISSGSNGWKARIGWDPVTGLGSFVASNLTGTLAIAKNA